MILFLADILLFAALLVTSACVVIMYRKLKRLDAYQAEYVRVSARSAAALDAARDAVAMLSGEGRELALALGDRIDSARALLAEIDARRADGSLAAAPRNAAPATREEADAAPVLRIRPYRFTRTAAAADEAIAPVPLPQRG